MGIRFRKSIRTSARTRLNVGSKKSSVSIGAPGLTVNVSRRGARATVGLPGTGISYVTKQVGGRRRRGSIVEELLAAIFIVFLLGLLRLLWAAVAGLVGLAFNRRREVQLTGPGLFWSDANGQYDYSLPAPNAGERVAPTPPAERNRVAPSAGIDEYIPCPKCHSPTRHDATTCGYCWLSLPPAVTRQLLALERARRISTMLNDITQEDETPCRHCGKHIKRTATRCGYCWRTLSHDA